MTAIKADDISSTLQALGLVQFKKGIYVIRADPRAVDHHLKAAGSGGLEVDVSKLVWPPPEIDDLRKSLPPGWRK